jgi:lytic murein transglycosylase
MKFLPHLRTIAAGLTLGLCAPLATACAQTVQEEAGFQQYLQILASRARAEGVSDATIAQMTAGLTLNARVVSLDRTESAPTPTPPPVAPYLRTHVSPSLIVRGKSMELQSAGLIANIESRYGVPGPIILAIWGHETNFGSYTGDFDLARSLASLAYEGRRRDLFSDEFIALLKMVDQGVPRSQLKGSFAGAFGNPQFLPTVYLRVAVDADGDGRRDIWNSRADTLASIANYFRDAGWRAGEPWGVRASIPAGFDRASVTEKLAAPTCAKVYSRHSVWKTVAEWRRLGISPLASIPDRTMASLFEPDGPGTPAYLLTGNYKVILQYNCSNYYALSVGLLADEIAR